MTQQIPLPATSPKSSHQNKNIRIVVLVIGLVIGLVLGIFVGVMFNLPSSFHTGVGVDNQVQVSGTVTNNMFTNILVFENTNADFETSVPIVNGRYSVLLVGGQSYDVFGYAVYFFMPGSSDYTPFYVPLGVTTFTENLVGF